MTSNHIFKHTILILTALTASCFLFDQSTEETLGQVHVEAALVADSCGPQTVSMGSTMSYEVELSRSGDSLRWMGPSGSIEGAFLSGDEFCIELADSWHVRDADPWYGDPGCEMQRVERLCGVLELEEEPLDDASEGAAPVLVGLTGRHEAFISGTEGSDCSDQLGLQEGQYLALPCQVVYDLVGTAIED